jgi:hypothetical protein
MITILNTCDSDGTIIIQRRIYRTYIQGHAHTKTFLYTNISINIIYIIIITIIYACTIVTKNDQVCTTDKKISSITNAAFPSEISSVACTPETRFSTFSSRVLSLVPQPSYPNPPAA